MARTRSIKPQFFHDVEILELPPLARLLYIGLWCYADKQGRIEDKSKQIKQDVLPSDACDVEQLLGLLANGSEPFIVRYAAKGKRVIQIIQFTKHQNPHPHEADSTLPSLEDAEEQDQAATCNDMTRQATTESVDDIASRAGSCSLVSGNGSLVSGEEQAAPDGAEFALSAPGVTVTPGTTSETKVIHSKTRLQVVEVSAFDSWFEREFWPAYPKKKAKEAAKKAAKRKMTTRALMDLATAAIKAQAPTVRDPQFFPNGSTWFNGSQWEDEVYAPAAPVRQRTKADIASEKFDERMEELVPQQRRLAQ